MRAVLSGSWMTGAWAVCLTAELRRQKTVTKNLPFSYPQMAADFVNAYILNNVGRTGNHCGACATFLYNLAAAVADIKQGEDRFGICRGKRSPHSFFGHRRLLQHGRDDRQLRPGRQEDGKVRQCLLATTTDL